MNDKDYGSFESDYIKDMFSAASEMPDNMYALSSLMANSIMNQAKYMLETVVGFKELMMMYACAIKEVRTKFEVLSTEFNTRYQRNPIQYISTRLKTNSGIVEKMERNQVEFSLANIEKHIHDVAGVRVICSYTDDIYSLADSLSQHDDITVLAIKDYIRNPKPNGYRSLHLIIEVPVFFANVKKQMKVEIQLRTTAMDCWAALEHQMKYKQEIKEQEQVVADLKICADMLSATDTKMLAIRKKIESAADIPDEESILFEKLRNLDKPII